MTLLTCLSYTVAATLLPLVFLEIGTNCSSVTACPKAGSRPLWLWCLCAAFAGGYVFMIRSFYRAINNFDFSPMSFVGACNNLAVGIVGALLLPFVVLNPLAAGIEGLQTATLIGAILLSFAIGYLPDSATRTLLWRSDLANFKRENLQVYKSSLTTPLEIIDGIDTETRDRLGDYHIRSTQNLATANPLMLFVETPFGVYQIMDWVAQAQLCCSVGPEALTKLWKLGIRTLFDLERVALDVDCYDKAPLRQIRALLIPATGADGAGGSSEGSGSGEPDYENTIVSNIVVRLDDPHVHRLRQIYIRIGDRLGPKNRRLPSSTRRRP